VRVRQRHRVSANAVLPFYVRNPAILPGIRGIYQHQGY
jgi:hypothetical protein